MSNEPTALSLTPHQQSDVAAASEQVYAEAADKIIMQQSGLDTAALLAMAAIVILFQVLSTEFRESSGIGLAMRDPGLRRVITVLLGFMSAAALIGESQQRKGHTQRIDLRRIIAGGVLVLYLAYVVSYVFMGLELATDSILPMLAEFAALAGIIALWQPWKRLRLYRKLLRDLAPALLTFVGVLILWEVIVQLFSIKSFLLPAPSAIATTFSTSYPRIVAQGWFTFQNALWGYAIGCGAGLLFGLASARFAGFSKAVLPYAVAINAIPIIAFAPIMNQWFGVSNPMSKIAVVAILSFFPVVINTVRGLTSTPPASLELMRSYAASEMETFTKLRIPIALPYIFNSLKVATTLSMIAAIVSEYFGGPLTGLGVNIADNSALSKYPLVWSQIVIASLLGIAFYFVVSVVERLVMPWHLSFREGAD